MPELPEVENGRSLIQNNCIGKTIIVCTCGEDSILFKGVTAKEFEHALIGRKITQALRKGKHLWWEMDQGPSPAFHFGMTGGFYVKGVEGCYYQLSTVDLSEWPPKFTKCFIQFEDDTELCFVNKRRFGRVRLLKHPALYRSPLKELGFDPVTEMPSVRVFGEILSKRKAPIKALLLNQKVIAGIGNWIADEVLYQSGILPEIPSAQLSMSQIKTLHRIIKKVIATSVRLNARASDFPRNWLFHYRWEKATASRTQTTGDSGTRGTLTTDYYGNPIVFRVVGGRTSAIVARVQKKHKVRKFRDMGPASSSTKIPPKWKRVGALNRLQS
eukprot:772489_1